MGIKPHPSDQLVHWSEMGTDGLAGRVIDLRVAWDLLHSTKKLAAAFDILERWQERYTDAERRKAVEDAAGEAIFNDHD